MLSFSRFAALGVALLAPAGAGFAQLPPPEEKPVVGARMPALSPDGKKLAFVWRGDIWVSDAAGGRAYAVTNHVELDAYPIFSPDGKWIAFSSMRNGNNDIYVVPATGGTPRRMTFSSANETVADWTPDGKHLLYATSYDVPNPTIFSLDVATLRFKKITEDRLSLANPQLSPDGKRLAFMRYGFPWVRPRYTGSAAAQILTLDPATGKRTEIAVDDRQHLWPRWMADGKSIVTVTIGEPTPNAQWLNKPLPKFVDSAAKTPNLWVYPATAGAKPRQLTRMIGGSVRYPAVARQSGDIVFEHEKDLYLLSKGAGEPKKLALFCGGEDKQNTVSREVVNSGVEEAEISPDGKTFAFLVRGDIWTIPVEKAKTRNAEDAVRLTDYAGFDRDFNWSADNKTLFFVSDRDNNDRIFAMDVESRATRPVWTGNADASQPKVSPDGKWLGFWVEGPVDARGKSTGGLYVKSTAADQAGVAPKQIIPLPGAAQGEFAWSPDMKWIAYTRRGVESSGMNVWITPADGSGTPVNVTRLNAFHYAPTWSPDGKYLFFGSNRDGSGLYVLPLKPEDARSDELEIKYEKPKGPVTVEIDFEDTAQRIRRVGTQAPQGDMTITADGQIFFVSEGDAFTMNFDGKDPARRLTTGGGVGNLRVAADGKTIYFYRSGGLFTQRIAPPGGPTPVTFTATVEKDLRAERRAAFTQFWRSFNTRFYDGNFHGRDWAAIRTRYEPLLDGVGTRDEFATLLNMMVGELESSHSEVGPAPGGTPSQPTRNLGVYFDYSYEGPGIKVKDVPKRAPGSYAKTRIKPGEYIVAIDGKDVTLNQDLFKQLSEKGDKDFDLLVNDKPGRAGARTVKYRALSGGEWSDIHYRNRVERARKLVESKSGGKLAYVHIQGMGGENQTTFDRELYEYADGKAGVIIDVRNNGGGNISDQLINWLGMKPYGSYVPRDGYPEQAPAFGAARSWNKPIIVLMNENSYSNAEMFPYGMRAAGIAKLVGQPTPGYVIWTSGLPLVDGTSARMPGSGVFRKDGSPMENMGEKPDYPVFLPLEDYLADRDPQLEKAIELLLK